MPNIKQGEESEVPVTNITEPPHTDRDPRQAGCGGVGEADESAPAVEEKPGESDLVVEEAGEPAPAVVEKVNETVLAVEEPPAHNPLHPPGYNPGLQLPGSNKHFPSMRPRPDRRPRWPPRPRKGDFKPKLSSLESRVQTFAAITHSAVLREVQSLLNFSRYYEPAGFTKETRPTEQQLIAMSLSELQELYTKLTI